MCRLVGICYEIDWERFHSNYFKKYGLEYVIPMCLSYVCNLMFKKYQFKVLEKVKDVNNVQEHRYGCRLKWRVSCTLETVTFLDIKK